MFSRWPVASQYVFVQSAPSQFVRRSTLRPRLCSRSDDDDGVDASPAVYVCTRYTHAHIRTRAQRCAGESSSIDSNARLPYILGNYIMNPWIYIPLRCSLRTSLRACSFMCAGICASPLIRRIPSRGILRNLMLCCLEYLTFDICICVKLANDDLEFDMIMPHL